jgi:beta-phosphoglucomutase-like phosphatase (HAD superfamily)
MSLKALIFDVDGTLADTERNGHRVAYNKTFTEMGLDWHWNPDVYGDLLSVSGGKQRMRYYIDKYQPTLPEDREPDALISDIYARKTEVFRDMLIDGAIPLRTGVERLFREARDAGLRLAIATTTAPSNIRYLIISNLGEAALDWFDIIAAGDIVPDMKPSPEIYQLVLNEMGWDAAECLAFEDSYNGVQSALGAGLPVIITITDYTRDEDFNGADLVLSGLGDPGHPVEVISNSRGDFTGDRLTVDYLRHAYS